MLFNIAVGSLLLCHHCIVFIKVFLSALLSQWSEILYKYTNKDFGIKSMHSNIY